MIGSQRILSLGTGFRDNGLFSVLGVGTGNQKSRHPSPRKGSDWESPEVSEQSPSYNK